MPLPTKRQEVLSDNPYFLILMSKPKVGKTTLLEGFENCLHVDFEKGGRYVSTMRYEVNDINTLRTLLQELAKEKKESGKEHIYEHIALDTATSLESLCIQVATSNYRKSKIGESFGRTGFDSTKNPPAPIYDNSTVMELDRGAGYFWLREAFKAIVSTFANYGKYIILLAHVKDKEIKKKGKSVDEYTIDLAGQLGRIIPSQADAIGYVYRDGDITKVTFDSGGDVVIGGRCKHLRGKTIEIAKAVRDEEGDITSVDVFMDKIYK